ncbi:MAG: tetratricopeptide repeat protein [Oscillatoriales cyanobacterium]|uniref:Tetratricopeptide repeat protein n=1 Tax=Microcoleus anatoxicus PTRS2 TaxID=2705321 RepID=A0ABU8YV77_9CYAN|nr:MAG: tetratricopeptide repeat protein [Oscillatoriales cyanobacterium]TAF06115.1 MAG: tetratricopeptide repeat protein [Oscillatoriales cyanobacterium]TAF47634.1 MAG: tetratricopeptide repeat protein [Oscillatoriales cyanobacterium]TAF66374.1 MAG: tetratricopeptide repeat protein [Oscillatoriales cyanobacterium]
MKTPFYNLIATLAIFTIFGNISPAVSAKSEVLIVQINNVKNQAEDLFNSGLAKSEAGDIQGAIADYTEAIRLNPDYAAAHNKRGIIRARDLKDYPAAKADFDRAIQIDPNYGDAYYNRARVREFLEDINGAIADYHTAAQFYQKSGKTNDYQDAIKHLQLLEQ